MASSSSLPAASAAVLKISATGAGRRRRSASIGFPLPLKPKKTLFSRPVKGLGVYWDRNIVAKAQLNEVNPAFAKRLQLALKSIFLIVAVAPILFILSKVVGGSSNDGAPSKSNEKVPVSKEKDSESEKLHRQSALLSEEGISEFLSQVASLVKLVDSKDIAELQLKQLDFELTIRKKVALPQPPAPAPVVMMQAPLPPMAMPSPVAPPAAAAAAALPSSAGVSSTSPTAPVSAPKGAKSSHPPLKSPMSGTFYRSPGPGLAPFVKVGDKVNKGQVLCIIEAMKLMNEIEADQAGTVVDVLVEDGKPVGIDQPIFLIEP